MMCRSLTIRAAPGGVEKTLARTWKRNKKKILNKQWKTIKNGLKSEAMKN
jgi:hypothetical protein